MLTEEKIVEIYHLQHKIINSILETNLDPETCNNIISLTESLINSVKNINVDDVVNKTK